MTALLSREVVRPEPRSTPGKLVRQGRAAVAATAAVMLVVGLWGLDRGSMWQDEQVTYEVASRTWSQLVFLLRHVDVVHGLYYALMHVWMAQGGGGTWMRLPSVVGMTVAAGVVAGLAAGVVAGLGARLDGPRVGLVAGLIFATSPLVSFYAQEARSFALVTAFVLLATRCLVEAMTSGGRRNWLAYGSCTVVAVALNELAVTVLLAHLVSLLWARASGAVWLRWLAVAGLCGVLVTPVVVLSHRQADQVGWLQTPGRREILELGGQLFGSTPWLEVSIAILAAVGVGRGLRRSSAAGVTLVAVALPLLIPAVVLIAASQVQPLFHVRYVLFTVAAVPLLAASGVAQLGSWIEHLTRNRLAGRVLILAVIVAVSVAQLPELRRVRTIESRGNDLAAAAGAVREHARPGDGVIFMPSRYRSTALAYPAAFVGLHDLTLDRTAIEAGNLRGVDKSRAAVRSAVLAQQRVWVVGRTNLGVRSNEPGALNERAVLRQRFRKVETYPVDGMEVALYEATRP